MDKKAFRIKSLEEDVHKLKKMTKTLTHTLEAKHEEWAKSLKGERNNVTRAIPWPQRISLFFAIDKAAIRLKNVSGTKTQGQLFWCLMVNTIREILTLLRTIQNS